MGRGRPKKTVRERLTNALREGPGGVSELSQHLRRTSNSLVEMALEDMVSDGVAVVDTTLVKGKKLYRLNEQ